MPSSKTRRRRARAVRRFLIQILVLAVLVAACAFLIFKTGGLTPASQPTPAPVDEPVPTPTPKPTPKPTPVPPPYPEDKLSAVSDVKVPEAKLDSPVMAMIDLAEPSLGDQNAVVVVSGWAFLTGKDASKTNTYVVLTGATDGVSTAYLARVLEDGQDVAEMFPDQGKNLDQARFECAINISKLPDDFYSVSVLLENGKTREHKSLEPPAYLDIRGGAAQ